MSLNISTTTVSQLSNDAASLIQQSHFDQAVAKLSNALKSAKQLVQTQAGSNPAINVTIDQLMAEKPTVSNKNGFSYQDPIYMSPALLQSPQAPVVVPVIIIFNLALAYQLSAATATSSSNRDSRLQKAARLYELAHNLHSEKQGSAEGSAIFLMAIVNNLGLVHYDLRETDKAEMFFEHLLSTLMFLVDCGGADASRLDCFFKTTSNYLLHRNVSAAAA